MPSTPITVEQILEPLIELLNSKYPTSENEEYLVPPFGQFGVLRQMDEECSIELPADLTDHELAVRAVATLLMKAGSNVQWNESSDPEENPYATPLRFSLLKRSMHMVTHWMSTHYLVVDFLGDDFDADAATQQVGRLVAHLEDPTNLIALTPEERSLLF